MHQSSLLLLSGHSKFETDYWLFVGAWGHVLCLEYTDGSTQIPAFNETHGVQGWAVCKQSSVR